MIKESPCRSFDLDEEGAECGFLIAAHQMLYRRPMIPLIPFTLEAVETRNHEALYGLVDSFGERGLSIGRDVNNLVECYERGPGGDTGRGEDCSTRW